MQTAIDRIESETKDKLTILIIAHRLTSIKSAKNLLFIERRDKISSYRKGTQEYENVMSKLKNITYAFNQGEEEEKEMEKILSIHESSANFQSINARREQSGIDAPPLGEIEEEGSDKQKYQSFKMESRETKPSF